jgi:diacylglycerol O-acyltransferase / wax synthase
MPGTLNHRLSATDASFLYFERPSAPLHIGSLAVYEGRIPFEKFVTHLNSRMPLIPRYRQRVAEVPMNLAHPTWEDDPDFNIRRQIHHVTLPLPGTDEQLRELTMKLFAQPLDRNKPLWEIFVIHGLQHDRTGMVSKVHHCMVDGVSGIELLVATLDISPEPAPPPEDDNWTPQPLPSVGERLTFAFWDNVRQQMDIAREVQESFLNPRPRFQQSLDVLRAMTSASAWAARPAPRTPFSAPVGPERTVAYSDMSFVEIRQIRTSLGGTVNDVVLAILAGALRKYFLHHGLSVEGWQPRVGIPVNVRMEDEKGSLGNRISAMVAQLPIGEADPAARLKLIREQLDQSKKENQAGALEMVLRIASYAPPALQALSSYTTVNTAINMICTNVPGPMIPLYCVGHLLLSHHPLVPLSMDMALGVGVTSYNQRLYFGLMADPKTVADIELLKQCLEESFLDLRAAAGVDVTDVPEFAHRGNGGSHAAQPAVSERSA